METILWWKRVVEYSFLTHIHISHVPGHVAAIR